MTESKTNLSLTLAEEDVRVIVQETIKAQVAVALESHGSELLRAITDEALESHVDSEGRPTRKGYSSMRYLDFAVNKAIAAAVREELSSWIEDHRSELRKMVAERLIGDGTPLADAMAEGMVGAMSTSWGMKVVMTKNSDL